jgi:EAL domain-containing protein (putative c-di-GMP-specific phosphodiesterase class I)
LYWSQMVPMATWPMYEPAARAPGWRGAAPSTVRVAVNVSAVQFRRADWVDSVRAVLQETDLPPAALELEITESVLLQNVGEITAKVIELRDMGVGIAIDDFGTGYSSLNYLHRLPVTTLKIDQSFVAQIGGARTTRGDGGPIVRTIIALAHNLGMTVVAEGVETERQRRLLVEWGCEVLQGFLLAHPVTADEIGERLRTSASRRARRRG